MSERLTPEQEANARRIFTSSAGYEPGLCGRLLAEIDALRAELRIAAAHPEHWQTCSACQAVSSSHQNLSRVNSELEAEVERLTALCLEMAGPTDGPSDAERAVDAAKAREKKLRDVLLFATTTANHHDNCVYYLRRGLSWQPCDCWKSQAEAALKQEEQL